MMPVPDAVVFLAGSWRIIRRIRDRLLGQGGDLSGTAHFTRESEGLRYAESGVLRFGAYHGDVSREYRFRPDHAGAMRVHFPDGRLFHRLDLSSGLADVAHDCAPDQYRGVYRVLGPHAWISAWEIIGPRKRMIIGTRYARMPEPFGTA